MTQKTKLEIIGEYRKDHPGPFCTRDGRPVDLKVKDGRGLYPLAGYIGDYESLDGWTKTGNIEDSQKEENALDLMCAREAPVQREFWVNEYHGGNRVVYDSPEKAQEFQVCLKRTIHMIEVLPGEGA
ncbi:hypothetical protein [Acetobacter sp. P5B1]|uniref:hypothetical protein n=1 Tax=Acetobacter sp. P5B1 TaxID=2762620 RepID=UPI001C03F8C8|nr:hypothetical protein [Acetobacter sp. P5B1]